jgi:hypothetical protein
MLKNSSSLFSIYRPAEITNSRIKQLVDLSSYQDPFDNLPDLIETFDESRLLSTREQFCPPHFHPIALGHESEYLLVYYDGQLVEVTALFTREIAFQNITSSCHQQVTYKHDWTPFSQQVAR